ncbi:Acetokinase family-domain-containing protein [Cristinia sonorae]|uniref:Probable acetate kinase n=1 Tax=Cristinia sonorae TaxID=1940300 RepID=A0A8K0XQN3_9AGAR|nr:Acetokinase family-domain-containing protein [Cristinia sonorae]
MSSPSDRGLILSVNSGSSSLKISLFRVLSGEQSQDPVELILESNTTSLTSPPAKFTFTISSSSSSAPPPSSQIDSSEISAEEISDHKSALAFFLKHLRESAGYNEKDIKKVCHRVVHGGDYRKPVVIDDESYEHLEKLSDLAPLHNGNALSVIRTTLEALPHASSIAYFDTAFHSTIPPHISTYMIDQNIAKNRGLRKYGFHGLSYAYILRTVSEHLSKPQSQTSLIVLHLGSGASICAIKNGQSLDTSMGLTPVSGLPGATRAGDVDGSMIFHYLARRGGEDDSGDDDDVGRMSHEKLQGVEVHVTRAEEILNKQSGWKSLMGTTDFGTIVQRRNAALSSSESPSADQDLAVLAFNIFVDRILTFLGSYFVKLGGKVDAVVFAGGIGERSVEVRESVVKGVECLGFGIDKGKNEDVQKKREEGGESVKVVDVSAEGAREKKVLVCWTDEQYEMARECTLEQSFWN